MVFLMAFDNQAVTYSCHLFHSAFDFPKSYFLSHTKHITKYNYGHEIKVSLKSVGLFDEYW